MRSRFLPPAAGLGSDDEEPYRTRILKPIDDQPNDLLTIITTVLDNPGSQQRRNPSYETLVEIVKEVVALFEILKDKDINYFTSNVVLFQTARNEINAQLIGINSQNQLRKFREIQTILQTLNANLQSAPALLPQSSENPQKDLLKMIALVAGFSGVLYAASQQRQTSSPFASNLATATYMGGGNDSVKTGDIPTLDAYNTLVSQLTSPLELANLHIAKTVGDTLGVLLMNPAKGQAISTIMFANFSILSSHLKNLNKATKLQIVSIYKLLDEIKSIQSVLSSVLSGNVSSATLTEQYKRAGVSSSALQGFSW